MERFFEKISFEQFEKDLINDPILYANIELPKRSTKNSAGYDFFSPIDIKIEKGKVALIPTGIKASMLDDEVLHLYVRSSLGIKKSVVLANQVGVIDGDYYNNDNNEGHIFIALKNEGDEEFHLKKGSAFAQGVFMKFLKASNEVEVMNERFGGIGSTDEEEKKPYYISTAIAYATAKPHIGNTYEIVLADAIARFKREEGYDVYFQTGSDEHGQKVEEKAAIEGLPPQKYVDNVSLEIRRIWDVINTSYDKFVRTTNLNHKKVVSNIYKKIYENGDIYKGEYEGLYCKPCESFYTKSQLEEEKCPDCHRELTKVSEEAYFFKLSKYQDRLLDYINENPEFIKPDSRRNEIVSFINQGLEDLCVSRTSFKWGVPIEFDEGHVAYVWIDALSNYITFLGYDPYKEQSEEFKKYWPADVHLIGKDITRFHAIYWPAFLMSLGLELPKQVFGHQFITVNSEKISKSTGNDIYADDLVKHFSVDVVRYYLLNEIPYSSDGNLSYELIIERNNSDLANVLGNLVNRTISMSYKYFDGIVTNGTTTHDVDEELKDVVLSAKDKVSKEVDALKVSNATKEVFKIFNRANKYIDETTPWLLAKNEEDKDRLSVVIYNLLESIRHGAILLKPFLPETSEKILLQLNTQNDNFDSLKTFEGLDLGTKLKEPKPLFERYNKEEKLESIEKGIDQLD